MSDKPLSSILSKKAAKNAAIQAQIDAADAVAPLFDQLTSAEDDVQKTLRDLWEISKPTAVDYARAAALLEKQLAAVWDALRAVDAIDRIAVWPPWPGEEGEVLKTALAQKVSADDLREALPTLNARILCAAWDDFRKYLWPNHPVSLRYVVGAFEVVDHQRACATANRNATPTESQTVEEEESTEGEEKGNATEPSADGKGDQPVSELTDDEERNIVLPPISTAPLSASELAQQLGQSTDAVDSFLRRHRAKHPDCFITVERDDRRRSEAKFRYRVNEVLPALRLHFQRKPKPKPKPTDD